MVSIDAPNVSVRRRELTILLGAALLIAAAPLVFYPFFIMKVLCFAIFALAYNLLFGYLGLLAFGHAAFFGAAAFVTAHLVRETGLSPELGLLGGVAVAASLGVAIGWLAIKRQGLQFAMITLALAQIVYFYGLQADWTHGEDGIQDVRPGILFGVFDLSRPGTLYVFVAAVFLIVFALLRRTVNSPFGLALRAVRDNEARATSLGYDVPRVKLVAFIASAALSGLAGSLKAIVFQIATLVDLQFTTSGDVLLMVLIGGIGSMFGPVVGAAVFVGMITFLAPLGSYVLIVEGVVFVFCVLFFRGGIVGAAESAVVRRRHARLSRSQAGRPSDNH